MGIPLARDLCLKAFLFHTALAFTGLLYSSIDAQDLTPDERRLCELRGRILYLEYCAERNASPGCMIPPLGELQTKKTLIDLELQELNALVQEVSKKVYHPRRKEFFLFPSARLTLHADSNRIERAHIGIKMLTPNGTNTDKEDLKSGVWAVLDDNQGPANQIREKYLESVATINAFSETGSVGEVSPSSSPEEVTRSVIEDLEGIQKIGAAVNYCKNAHNLNEYEIRWPETLHVNDPVETLGVKKIAPVIPEELRALPIFYINTVFDTKTSLALQNTPRSPPRLPRGKSSDIDDGISHPLVGDTRREVPVIVRAAEKLLEEIDRLHAHHIPIRVFDDDQSNALSNAYTASVKLDKQLELPIARILLSAGYISGDSLQSLVSNGDSRDVQRILQAFEGISFRDQAGLVARLSDPNKKLEPLIISQWQKQISLLPTSLLAANQNTLSGQSPLTRMIETEMTSRTTSPESSLIAETAVSFIAGNKNAFTVLSSTSIDALPFEDKIILLHIASFGEGTTYEFHNLIFLALAADFDSTSPRSARDHQLFQHYVNEYIQRIPHMSFDPIVRASLAGIAINADARVKKQWIESIEKLTSLTSPWTKNLSEPDRVTFLNALSPAIETALKKSPETYSKEQMNKLEERILSLRNNIINPDVTRLARKGTAE